MLVVTNKKRLAPLFIVLALKLHIVTGLDNLPGKSSRHDYIHNHNNNDDGIVHNLPSKLPSINPSARLHRRSAFEIHNNDEVDYHNYHGDSVSLDTLDGSTIRKQLDPSHSTVETGDGNQTRRRRKSRQNLCEHLCSCDLDAKFVTVNCSFLLDKEYILGEHYSIPNTTRRLRINLADRTALRLDDGFFKQNNVNSVQITGLVGHGGQIEITKHAFAQNLAVYPEIVINRCSKLILKEHAFRGEKTFY